MQVLITNASQQGGDGSSVADQALNVANTALALAQSVQASIPQRRSQATPISIPTGDSPFVISWPDNMPDDNYEVRGTFYGPSGLGSSAIFYVVDSTRTVGGCTLRLCNVPANFSFAYVVEDLSVT